MAKLMDEEYAELVRDAKDALYALLRETEPGTGVALHHACGDLRRMLEEHELALAEVEKQAEQDAARAEREAMRAAYEAWRDLSRQERQRHVIEVVGDRRLTGGEITARLQQKIGQTRRLFPSEVRPVLDRMVRDGELDRVMETSAKNTPRYRYFRRPLSGEIAALDRMLAIDGDA